ncbi:MAG: hypothetical protein ABFD83_08940 [Armatimonadota bacterium]
MHKVLWGLSVIMIAAIAGCGGGGGSVSGTTPSSSLKLSDEVVGAWQVASLSLPNNQIVIEEDGDVAVEVTGSQTRGDSTVVIGSCGSDGTLSLNGNWTADGAKHTIDATGSVDSNSSKLSLCATVRQDEEIICQNVTVTGVRSDDTSDQTGDDVETPPAPPSMDDPYDTPPAPPSF